jgi:hypothetical protein
VNCVARLVIGAVVAQVRRRYLPSILGIPRVSAGISQALGPQMPDTHSSSNTQSPASGNRPNSRHIASTRPQPSFKSRSTRPVATAIWAHTFGVSSFCSLMWIARGRTGRSLRYAPASTNTVSTPMARTLRICACDRSLAPAPNNPHRKKERPK